MRVERSLGKSVKGWDGNWMGGFCRKVNYAVFCAMDFKTGEKYSPIGINEKYHILLSFMGYVYGNIRGIYMVLFIIWVYPDIFICPVLYVNSPVL